MSDGNNIEVGFQVTGADQAAAEIKKVGDAAKAAAEPTSANPMAMPQSMLGPKRDEAKEAAEAAEAAVKAAEAEKQHADAMKEAAKAAKKETEELDDLTKTKKAETKASEDAALKEAEAAKKSIESAAPKTPKAAGEGGINKGALAVMAAMQIAPLVDKASAALREYYAQQERLGDGGATVYRKLAEGANLVSSAALKAAEGFAVGGPIGAAIGGLSGLIDGGLNIALARVNDELDALTVQNNAIAEATKAATDARKNLSASSHKAMIDAETDAIRRQTHALQEAWEMYKLTLRVDDATRQATAEWAGTADSPTEKAAAIRSEWQKRITDIDAEKAKTDRHLRELSQIAGIQETHLLQLLKENQGTFTAELSSVIESLRSGKPELANEIKLAAQAAKDMEEQAPKLKEIARQAAIKAVGEAIRGVQEGASEKATEGAKQLMDAYAVRAQERGGSLKERYGRGFTNWHNGSQIANDAMGAMMRNDGIVAPAEMPAAVAAAARGQSDPDANDSVIAAPLQKIIEAGSTLSEGMSQLNALAADLGKEPAKLLDTIKDSSDKAIEARNKTELGLHKRDLEENKRIEKSNAEREKRQQEAAEKRQQQEEARAKRQEEAEDKKRQQAEERAMRASEARVRKTEESLMRNAQAGSALGEAAVSKLNQHTSDLALLKGRIR